MIGVAKHHFLISPLARKRAYALGINLAAVRPQNGVRVVVRDVLRYDAIRYAAPLPVAATGEAERLAQRWGIKLPDVRPTGFDGTVVTAADVALARQQIA